MDSEILKLLTNINKTTPASEVEQFPKLSPRCAEQISKNIANILYDSLTITSSSQVKERQDILLLLQKWCSDSGKHFRIDNDNYDCFLNVMKLEKSDVDNDGPEKVADYWITPYDKLKWSVSGMVCNYQHKVTEIAEKRTKFLRIIRQRDYEKCNYDVNFKPKITMKRPNYCKYLSWSGEDYKHEDAFNINPAIPVIEDETLRTKDVKLAYSLLNFGNVSLLSNILHRLKRYAKLQSDETDLIFYLWNNLESLNLPEEISLILIENFTFIYEKSILRLCTNVLNGSIDYKTMKEFTEMKKILKLSTANDKIMRKINNLLYELYAYSCYNKQLYNFFVVNKFLQ